MHLHRRIAASLVAAALIAPAAAQAAASPDDRALYRGSTPAVAPKSQSPDDRSLYRGSSDNLIPASPSPDDRSFARSVTEREDARKAAAAELRQAQENARKAAVPVVVISNDGGYRWLQAGEGAAVGFAFAAILAGLMLLIIRSRRVAPAA
jgi:hypothetical protein